MEKKQSITVSQSLHIFNGTEFLSKRVINIYIFLNLVLFVLLVSNPMLAEEHPTTSPPSVPLLITGSVEHAGQISSCPRTGPTECPSALEPPGSSNR